MDIDMSALRGLVREKEISFDLLVEAIESASSSHTTAPRAAAVGRGSSWTATPVM
ncbi:hypothetical protein Scani_81830 [Streptomyces caniferus]|uniref:Uncharacterized protein n=1 Tax=Streptomyces caniferus TaxID=285557 RepID=A0A640SR25_9ACTN|nr:hypothetical protein Scani_81830 [Streptomyces caniferus]